MKRLFLLSILITFFAQTPCYATSGREFTTSVVYGTLAGTLVGAATLAFTSNPGDNLNNVARGASYGLYAGILLGLYVTYAVGDDKPKAEQQPGSDSLNPDQNAQPPQQQPAPDENKPQSLNQKFRPTLAFFPIIPGNPAHPHDWGVGATVLDYHF